MSEFKNKISLFHKRETRKQINMNHESLEYLFFFWLITVAKQRKY